MSAEDIKPDYYSTVTIVLPAGKSGMKAVTGSLDSLISTLPQDVQGYLKINPHNVQRILSGEVIKGSTSNGACECKFEVSKNGYIVTDSRRDG